MMANEGEGEIVDMGVQDVEVLVLEDELDHEVVGGEFIDAFGVEPEGPGADGLECCGGDGVCAGEEGDVVPQLNKFFGEVGDDAFGATIAAWWDAFGEGGDLGYAQGEFLLRRWSKIMSSSLRRLFVI